jgi:hypothetical protein
MTKRTFGRYRVLGDGKRLVKTRNLKKHIQKNVKSKFIFPFDPDELQDI